MFSRLTLVAAMVAALVSCASPGFPGPAASLPSRDSVSVVVEGEAVASAVVHLRTDPAPCPNPNAEYMTLGPFGEAMPEPAPDSTGVKFRIEWAFRHRLRVTLGSSERVTWAIIEDVPAGRADTRMVHATYWLSPWDTEVGRLHGALAHTRRVRGPEPASPIVWSSPTSFNWVTSTDTLIIEQLEGPKFRVTLRLVR